MATIQEIKVWKKGTNKQTGMHDFQVEMSLGDLHTMAEAINAIMEIESTLYGRKKIIK
jgi:hypothetical protein